MLFLSEACLLNFHRLIPLCGAQNPLEKPAAPTKGTKIAQQPFFK